MIPKTENIQWNDETGSVFWKVYIWHKLTQYLIRNNITPIVNHGGGSIMALGCFAALGAGRLAIIDGIVNSNLYQKNLKPSVFCPEAEAHPGYAAGQQQNIRKIKINKIKRKQMFWSGLVKV